MDTISQQFLNALWKLDPESAIESGKYDGAANLTIPNAATRAHELAFADEWLQKFGKIDARQLSAKQRTDLALLVNKVKADRWYLTTFREYEWNPALYNIAKPIDLVLNTEYAAKPQRLRTLLRRIANVPAYYQAAQASLVNPTHEHTAAGDRAGAGHHDGAGRPRQGGAGIDPDAAGKGASSRSASPTPAPR